jgi:RNA polymerase sigma factor (sigma-70 family)
MNPCPSSDCLARLLAGELGDAERAAVGRHVDGCAACQQLLDRLGAAGDPDGLRRAPAAGSSAGREFLRRLRASPPAVHPRPAAGVPAETLTPSRAAAAAEQARALQEALARLPEAYRLVLRYRYDEGRPFAEVARLMGRSPNAARKLWARAVEWLQQELRTP